MPVSCDSAGAAGDPPEPSGQPFVLAVDTAGDACSVAVARGERVLAQDSDARRHGHAELLVGQATRVLAAAGAGFADIDAYAVTTGPGGFTGIRIGIAAVAGMALAHDRPMLGIDSFTAGLDSVPSPPAGRDGPPRWLVALDSRRGDLFCRVLDRHSVPLGPAAVLMPERLAAWLPAGGPFGLAGNGAPAARGALPPDRIACDGGAPAVDPGRLALLAVARIADASRRVPAPLYLRDPDARPAPPLRPGGPRPAV